MKLDLGDPVLIWDSLGKDLLFARNRYLWPDLLDIIDHSVWVDLWGVIFNSLWDSLSGSYRFLLGDLMTKEVLDFSTSRK